MKRRNIFKSLVALPLVPKPVETPVIVETYCNQYGEPVVDVVMEVDHFAKRMKQAIEHQRSLTRASMRAGRSDDNCGSADPQRGGGDRDSGAGA